AVWSRRVFFFSSRRRHTRSKRDWSSDVCSSDLKKSGPPAARLGDEIQHKSFLGALAGAVLGAIVTIAEGCLIMAACATGPYALEIGRASCRERVEGGAGAGGVARQHAPGAGVRQ